VSDTDFVKRAGVPNPCRPFHRPTLRRVQAFLSLGDAQRALMGLVRTGRLVRALLSRV